MVEYEYHRFGDIEEYRVKEYDDFEYPYPHFHRNYELLLVFSGCVKVVVDTKEYNIGAGNFLLIFPNQIHAFYRADGASARVAIFSPLLVRDFYDKTANLIPKVAPKSLSAETWEFLDKKLKPDVSPYILRAALYSVIGEIAEKTEFINQGSGDIDTLIHALITYISKNFKSNITLKTAALALGYSYQHLSKSLALCNLNFCSLLNSYRLDFAKSLLRGTNLPITEIAFECGYSSVRTFNRNFVASLGVTPNKYRKNKDEN